MIVTISFNPAIDQTIDINKYEYTGINRVEHTEIDAGGKGINVAKNLKILSQNPIVLGFIGGRIGNIFKNMINNLQIKNDFTYVYGETRINTKIIEKDGKITEFNGVGPEITSDRIEDMMIKIDTYATEDTLFVLSGKIYPGVDSNLFRKIIKLAHDRGAKIAIDSSGEVLEKVMLETPEILKIKLKELKKVYNREELSENEILEIANKFIEKGVKSVIISMADKGAIFVNRKEAYLCTSPKVKTHSTIGAGDALMAGLIYGLDKKLDFEKISKLATAMSVGAVMTIGTKPSSKETIEKLYFTIDSVKLK